MKFFQMLKCLRGQHKRSRSKAWQDGLITRSECRGCGKPMFRDGAQWKLDPSGAKIAD